MTTQKDFKRLVRGRMRKTGESYTTARASLLSVGAKRRAQGTIPSVEPGAPRVESNGQHDGNGPVPLVKPADLAKIAGMSDEKLKEKTGCAWDRWVWALDHVNAYNWPHKEIARYVHEKYDVPGWWAQSVTVGYERIHGLRERGQRRSGSWEASKSKTIEAAAGTVFRSFKQEKLRAAWLSKKGVVRTSVPNKSLRMTWEDGTSVEVYLEPKGRSKSQVVIQHTKLASRQDAERMKAFWAAHLEALATKLSAKH